MTQREKILAAAVAATGMIWIGNWGWSAYQTELETRRHAQTVAEEELDDARFAIARGQRARRRLNEWRRQSLPANRQVAESLYQDWLRKQLTESGLEAKQIAARSGIRSKVNADAPYDEASLEIREVGTIAQFADFLGRFYSAAMVHRISAATLVRDEADNTKLAATLSIDALILAGVERQGELPEEPLLVLARPAGELRTEVEGRNLFAPYKPAASPTAVAEKKQDQAVVSGMLYGERGWRLDVRDGADVQHFFLGDRLKFGDFQGELVDVDGRRAVISTPAGKVEVHLGQNLGEAEKLENPGA